MNECPGARARTLLHLPRHAYPILSYSVVLPGGVVPFVFLTSYLVGRFNRPVFFFFNIP